MDAAIKLTLAAGRAKDEAAFSKLVFRARKIFSGSDLVAVAQSMRMEFERSRIKGNPMAAKKKKARKKVARKNPVRHIPKTTRGRKPISRKFRIDKFDKNGNFLGNLTFSGTIANAENKAAKLVKGKVAKVILEY
jgi:hypothetical protein